MTTSVLYATKYGSTGEYAREVARRLCAGLWEAGSADLSALSASEMVVVGSPIYGFSVLPAMEEFLRRNGYLLRGKRLAAFVVCGDAAWMPEKGEAGAWNLEKLVRLLPGTPMATAVFGGRMKIGDLDDDDAARIAHFYRMLGREPKGFDRMDVESVIPFVKRIISLSRHGV